MATWKAFYIIHENLKKIEEKLRIEFNKFDIDFNKNKGVGTKEEPNLPSYFSIGKAQSDWVIILHNSINKLINLSEKLSKDLNCNVIVTIAQSVSDSYYFSVYDKGQKIREIETCYSSDFQPIDFGMYFDFENDKPGRKLEFEDDSETQYIFDFQSIESYCQEFNLNIQTNYDELDWIEIEQEDLIQDSKDIELQIPSNESKKKLKAWWRFW